LILRDTLRALWTLLERLVIALKLQLLPRFGPLEFWQIGCQLTVGSLAQPGVARTLGGE